MYEFNAVILLLRVCFERKPPAAMEADDWLSESWRDGEGEVLRSVGLARTRVEAGFICDWNVIDTGREGTSTWSRMFNA
jgi:hypothetical protein